ncbi:MAG: MMPL family transporter [bacterium]
MNLLQRIVEFINTLPYRYPVPLIVLATIFAAAGGYIYFNKLPIISDRAQLTSNDLKTNRIYKHYREEFGDEELIVLVVSPQNLQDSVSKPTQEQRKFMKQVARQWSDRLRERPQLFPAVWERIAPTEWHSLALLYLRLDDLRELTDVLRTHMAEIKDWASAPTFAHLISIVNNSFKTLGNQADGIDKQQVSFILNTVTDLVNWLTDELRHAPGSLAVNGTNGNHYPFLSQGDFDPDGFFFFNQGSLLIAFASITGKSNQRNRYAESIEYAQNTLQQALQQVPQSMTIDAGLAGMPALEYEEMKTAQQDFARSGVIALLCVTLLFMVSFSRIVRPALATLSLCFAIGITFGYTWLVVGHLNLLAMIFTVILITLGIDFAIHFVTHYEMSLAAGCSPAQAIKKVHSSIGGAVWMGGITTAAAFISAYFTEFAGLAELGIIAGGGLLICVFCMYFIYPALLFLVDTHAGIGRLQQEHREKRIKFINLQPPAKKSRLTIALALPLVIIGYSVGQFDFDSNLLNLQATDSPAERWQRVLTAHNDRSLFAVSTFTDRDSLLQVQDRFENSEVVAHTESLFPTHEMEKRDILCSLRDKVESINLAKPDKSSAIGFKRQIWNLRNLIRKYRRRSSEAKAALADLESAVSSLYRTTNKLTNEGLTQNLQQAETAIYRDLNRVLPELKRLFCPPAFAVERLPKLLRKRFLGKNGSLALFTYPAKNVWRQENLAEFVQKARAIDPNIVGEAVSLYENGNSIIRSFLQASIYSLVAIVILIFVWSRPARTTFYSLVPLVAGIGLLLGTMHAFSLKWNFTNFFALPILIGIGVDSGIHLVKAWQDGNGDTFLGAGKAVLLSSLTTIIGFGILATSDHIGVRSLGLVLFSGITFVLLASVILLPAILNLFERDGNE